MKDRFYNDWSFNAVAKHCRCEVKDSDTLNDDSNTVCCTAFASDIMSFYQVNKCEFSLVLNFFIKKIKVLYT